MYILSHSTTRVPQEVDPENVRPRVWAVGLTGIPKILGGKIWVEEPTIGIKVLFFGLIRCPVAKPKRFKA